MFVAAQMQSSGLVTMPPSAGLSLLRENASATVEGPPMTAYRSLKVFSHVVLGLMLAGIAYASAISVIYWTGISV